MPICRSCRRPVWQPMPTSRRTGGCTFPEDPAEACASVLPIWSAGVDPRVLAVRAVQPVDATGERVFDALSGDTRIVRSEEHTSETPVTNAHIVCRLLHGKKTQTQYTLR